MGYTHYYHVESYYEEEVWDDLVKDVKKLLEIAWGDEDDSTTLLGDLISKKNTSLSKYYLDENQISFNGVGEDAHEQFQLYQRMPPEVFEKYEESALMVGSHRLIAPYTEFTKTAHKPYDLVVCCCLILAKKHFGDKILVTSDGTWEQDWQHANETIMYHFGYTTSPCNEDDWDTKGMFEVE